MGTFVTATATPTLFSDKSSAASIALRPGWTVSNVLTAAQVNALRDSLMDVRTAIRGREFNAKNYGALGDGSTNDSTAVAAAATAAASGELFFPPGTYVLSTGATFTGRVVMAFGAKFQIASNQTVTFNGELDAPIAQLFSGAGTAVFNKAKNTTGYLEWWGGVTGGTDCLASFNLAKAAVRRIQLMAGDYHFSARAQIDVEGFELLGSPEYLNIGTASRQGTRILSTSGTADVVFVGTDASPGTTSDFLAGVRIRDIHIGRTIAPVGNATPASAGAGLKLQYTRDTYIDRIQSVESCITFFLNGCVTAHLTDCRAFRSTAASSGSDFFYGFYANGSAAIGLAGGNASTYINDCNATMGGAISSTGASAITSVGFYFFGAFVDTFVDRPETSACQKGLWLNGVTGNPSATTRKSGNVDFQLRGPILDSFTTYGLVIENCSTSSAVSVLGGYVAPGDIAVPATAAIFISASTGTIKITDTQCICWPEPTCLGVYVLNSAGVQWDGIVMGSARPVGLEASSNIRILGAINNSEDAAVTTSQAAVYCDTVAGSYIGPAVQGGATRVTEGVRFVGTTCSRNEVNCTLIDAACLNTVSANKLIINGVQITAVGASGTHYVSGVMT